MSPAFDERLHPRDGVGRFSTKTLAEGCLEDLDTELDLSWLDEPADGCFGDIAEPSPAQLLAALIPQARRLGEVYRCRPEHRNVADLNARFGTDHVSLEAAVRHIGAAVRTRAEELSGTSAQQVASAWTQRTEVVHAAKLRRDQAMGHYSSLIAPLVDQAVNLEAGSPEWNAKMAEVKQLQAARSAARDAVEAPPQSKEIMAGTDLGTRSDLRALADGYQAALAEVRTMGGAMVFDPHTPKTAVAAFDEAQDVFPSSWIQQGNANTPVYARVLAQRARYISNGRMQTRRTEPVVEHDWLDEDGAAFYRSRFDREIEPTGERDGEAAEYRITFYETAFDEDDGEPIDMSGKRGWKRVTKINRAGEPVTAWRKQKTSTLSETVRVPEIRTRHHVVRVEGRSTTYAVSVHESAHRYEDCVAGLAAMEADFLDRRWRERTDDQSLPRTERIYPYKRGNTEIARDGGFPDRYMGKTYGGPDNSAPHTQRFHEVLSCGTEALFGGRYGGLVGVANFDPDPDLRDFVLGVLACGGAEE